MNLHINHVYSFIISVARSNGNTCSDLLEMDALIYRKACTIQSEYTGSLKEVAQQYEVTYPTVRLRLDKLIQKIKISDDVENEPYISLIKRLALNEKIDFETAKILIAEYKKNCKEGGK